MVCDKILVLVLVGLILGSQVAEGICTQEQWFYALKSGDLSTTARCLKNHPDVVNSVDELGCAGLVVAAGNNNFAAVKMLAAAPFVDVNAACRSGNTALHVVARKGNVETTKSLLTRGAMFDITNKAGESPLSIAAAKGHIALLVLFYFLDTASLQGSWSGTELMWAAAHNNVGEAKVLLDRKGYDMDEQDHMGQLALHWAARTGSLDSFNFLVSHGESVHAISSNGWTPAFYAAYFGQTHILERILELGGVFSGKDKLGWTPIMWAAAGGHVNAIQFIKQHGGDVHKQEKHGWTPLMMAAATGKTNAAAYLLTHDGNWRATNDSGDTARDIAEKLEERDLFHLLNNLHHVASSTDRDHSDL